MVKICFAKQPKNLDINENQTTEASQKLGGGDYSQVPTTTLLIVFNWNHFEMRLLNLRINFYLLVIRLQDSAFLSEVVVKSPEEGQRWNLAET